MIARRDWPMTSACVEFGTAHAPISWSCLAVAVPVKAAAATANAIVSDVKIRLYISTSF